MDSQKKCVADNDRFAFLLGSALRNDDSDQFFCIYDSIIPKDLPEDQVERIKEQACIIADLPEEEFSDLVLNARDFSLARGRPSPPPVLAMSSSDAHAPSDHEENEHHVTPPSLMTKLDIGPNVSSHRHTTAVITDDDSGLPSSTKTGRRNSLSSNDASEVEEKEQLENIYLDTHVENEVEETVVVPRVREMVVVSHTYNPDYDEEIPVEHDDESIESPRSDASSTREYDLTQLDGEEGFEMTTFSSEQRGYYDEDSDDEIHSSPYSSGSAWYRDRPTLSSSTSINFSRSAKLLAEEKSISSLRNMTSKPKRVDDSVNFSLGTPFSSTSKSLGTPLSSTSKSTSVDDSVNFSLGSFFPSSSKPKRVNDSVNFSLGTPFSSSNRPQRVDSSVNCTQGTQFSSTRHSPDEALSGLHATPPFGVGADLLKKVGQSVSSLMEATSYNLNPTSTDTVGENKKKQKKKKKGNKDNGPEESGTSEKTITQEAGDGSSKSAGVYPMPGLRSEDNALLTQHEMGLADTAGLSATAKTRRKPKKTRQQGVEVHPEKDKDYCGYKPVDDLVKYILNSDNSTDNVEKNKKSTECSTNLKSGKKKKRNAVERLIKGCPDTTSESHSTSSEDKHLTGEESESEGVNGSLGAHGTSKMGNTSSTEKLDTREDTTRSSSNKPCSNAKEHEKNKKKSPQTELFKNEAMKNYKNDTVSKSKSSSRAKQGKSDRENDKFLEIDRTKDTDSSVELEGKSKNSKKGKPGRVKKDSQNSPNESKHRPVSPPSPGTHEIPTDFASSAQGQWCTVVSKPQKKKRTPPQTVSASQNHFSPAVAPPTRSKHFFSPPSHSESNQKSQAHNGYQQPNRKPLSSAQSSAGSVECDSREKDLNPLNFPVLISSPRGYRGSLENIFDTGGSVLMCDKDSDRESSKSFPADLSGVDSGRISYAVSYATMASTNTARESADSSKAESITSSIEESGIELPANSTSSLNWKGSPQERRHSIGSAPKEFPKNTLQRTGSQEMLPREESKSHSMPVSNSNNTCQSLVPSDSTGSFTGSDADSARGSEIGSEDANEELTTPSLVSSKPNLEKCVTDQSPTVCARGKAEPVKQEKTKASGKYIPVDSSHRSQVNGKSNGKITPSTAKQVNNGRKRGVVFCCNKNESSTPISGLHFGFFPEDDFDSTLTKIPCDQPSVPSLEDSPSVPVLHSSQSAVSLSNNPNSLHPRPPSSSSSDVRAKPVKLAGPHMTKLNGVVSPQTSPDMVLESTAESLPAKDSPSHVSSESSECEQESGEVNPVSASSPDPDDSVADGEPTLDSKDMVICRYGGQLPNKPLNYAIYVRPPSDIEKAPSQNVIKAANFLRTTWVWKEFLSETMKNAPKSVVVYSE